MRAPISDFWGKLISTAAGLEWHPWIDHSADVAAVCEALLRCTLIRRRMAVLGGRADLSEPDIQRLSVNTALHDIGKPNLGFQNKATDHLPIAGHVGPIVDVLHAHGSIEQRWLIEATALTEIETWADDDAGLELLMACICHHGRPVEAGNHDVRLWQPVAGRDPFEGIARLTTNIQRWFPAAFERGVRRLPANPEFVHALCGLVTLADWIGSDRTVFRYTEPGDGDRMAFARRQAFEALRRIGLDTAPARAAYRAYPASFEQVFGFAPHAMQRTVSGLPIDQGGELIILESETGSGKTEAALARFIKMFDAGLVDGIYFALPTRTAAYQIYRRVETAVQRAFPDATTRPPVILAVPGYLDEKSAPLAPFGTLWPDKERNRYRHWAAEHPKRYLSGAISIGTIDQVLLSALRVNHSHLRATPLLRQLLVVDEVHASDAYMMVVLREVVRFHLAAGGYALMLSATLGSRAVSLLSSTRQPTRAEAEARRYPLVTAVGANIERMPITSESTPKKVMVELAAVADDPATISARALRAVLAGARVLVVRNTVRDCIETQIELERIVGTSAVLFGPANLPAPHHSRFARVDRLLLDRELEARFGKASAAPCVAVATQTVQQSLDIDADLLLTDLCPMDIMLQRIGRLHRHRRERAEAFQQARLIVLTPCSRDLAMFIGSDDMGHGPHGLGTVYEDLRILEATWRALEAAPLIEIPSMNRLLVEAAVHPEALTAIVSGERWRRHAQTIEGATLAVRGLAALNCVRRDLPFSECRFRTALEARITARLGIDDRMVDLDLRGPFGAAIDRLTIPGWLVRGAPADAEAKDIVLGDRTIHFIFGGRAFVYDRLGLRLAATTDAEEDLADA